MTKEIILPMNEITDSVEMLHEKPNKGMPVFTWILVLLLAAAISWCCIGEIDYFIKASGIVRPGENISTRMKLSITLDTLTARILKLSSDSQSRIEPTPFYSWWNTTDCRADPAVAPIAHKISPDHRF